MLDAFPDLLTYAPWWVWALIAMPWYVRAWLRTLREALDLWRDGP